MKTAEKLAAGWLITLGFMLTTISAQAMINKHLMFKQIPPGTYDEYDYPNHYAVAELDTTAVNGIIFGLPSLALGGWLALGMRRRGKKEENAIAQQIDLHLQSMFYRMIAENQGTHHSFRFRHAIPATSSHRKRIPRRPSQTI